MDTTQPAQARSSMSPTRPSMSIAMPPALGQFYTAGEIPKTPKNDNDNELLATEPPPPPRQTYKIKRKRVVTQPTYVDVLDAAEHVIPTIEMSEVLNSSPGLLSSPVLELSAPANGLLAPIPHIFRSITPPKTPSSKSTAGFDQCTSPSQEWGLINDSNERRSFERTGSIGSSFSDSSLSSLGSSAFSAMSPTSEATTDPFLEDDFHSIGKAMGASLVTADSPDAKRAKTNRRAMWTPAMDDHLWLTYMAYLSDPTLTPFKMLPGTAPPLGVCHRVASKAKRTWREHKTISSSSLEKLFTREESPDTIRPESSKMAQLKQSQWPRSESETRKRLRALCKKRPSLSAHYQRLLRARSPSPFQSSAGSSSAAAASRLSEPPSTAFSSVDMKMSLITSTSSSMRPDGPLAQLANEDMPVRPSSSSSNHTQTTSRPADWFSRIGRSQAHQKSLSLQSGLGLNTRSLMKPTSTSLASPFDDNRSHLLQSSAATKSLGRDFNHSAPFLDSPFEGAAATVTRSLKRRFRSDEEKPKRLPLQGIFDHAEPLSGLRNRGFSLGTGNTAGEMARLFQPPVLEAPVVLQAPTPDTSEADHEMLDIPDVSMLGPPGSRSAPRRLAEPTPRLGSPFTESAAARHFNTFPRSYLPSTENPQPFQRRLQELVTQQQQL